MNAFIDTVYMALRNAGHTDATITPKLVFDAMRAETNRLSSHGIGYGVFPTIFKRDAGDMARIEKAVGSRLSSFDIGKAMVQGLYRELSSWWTPDVEDTEWLSHELDFAARSRGGSLTPAELTDDLIALRDTLAFRGSVHPQLSAMTDEAIGALATRAHTHVRENRRAYLLPIELAANLQSIWRFGTTLDQPPRPSARVAWIESRIAEPRADRNGWPEPHTSLALADAAGLDRTTVATYVQHGLYHEPKLDRKTIEMYSPEQRAAFFARVRDVNNVIFTQSCLDLGARIAAAMERAHAPVALRTTDYDALKTLDFVTKANNAATMQAFADARAANPGAIDHVATCVMSEEDAAKDGLIGFSSFYVRLPVGELGERFTQVLTQAMEIARQEAQALGDEIALDVRAHPFNEAMAGTTLLQSIKKILVEGVVSIAQTLALLLAKRPAPPHDDIDKALKLIDESRLVTQVAGMAPFGVLAPMAVTGLVPGQPISIVQKINGERAQLPAGFEEVLHAVRESRVEFLHHGKLFDWADHDHKNETGRGCPVAGRGPVLAADGKVTSSREAPLSVLTHHFIELTRRLLAESP